MTAKYDRQRCQELIHENIDIDFFRIICDPVRSELLVFMAGGGEMTIGEIAENFPQNRSVISRHLDLMNRLGVVTRRKVGREVYYTIQSQMIVDKFSTTASNLKNLLNSPAASSAK